ncbi:LysE family translocator [Paenibacillus sp. KS-LC4]|uniref:LysE family translocator n=1 Tax=Paenibacillus sp. KS-LC4 TaxID=2979727 RepID=UPI0030CF9232
MEWASLISFLGVAVLLTLMPGPDNLYVLTQSIARGKKAGIITTLGLCTGLFAHISAAALGISAIVYQSATAFAVVKYAGAAYLLYLAYKAFRQKQSALALGTADELAYASLYKKGIFMSMLNPKVSLFFLALLPQFVNEVNGYASLQMITLGLVFMLQAIVIFTLISVFADVLRRFIFKRPHLSSKMNIVEGSVFGLIGLSIAFSRK